MYTIRIACATARSLSPPGVRRGRLSPTYIYIYARARRECPSDARARAGPLVAASLQSPRRSSVRAPSPALYLRRQRARRTSITPSIRCSRHSRHAPAANKAHQPGPTSTAAARQQLPRQPTTHTRRPCSLSLSRSRSARALQKQTLLSRPATPRSLGEGAQGGDAHAHPVVGRLLGGCRGQ